MLASRAMLSTRWRWIGHPPSPGAKLPLGLTAIGIAGAIGLGALLRQLVDLRQQIEVQGFAPGRSKSAAAAMAAEAQEREATRRELGVGREAMAQVLEIIGQQQKDALERPVLEPCDFSAIIASNATIARQSTMISIAFSFLRRRIGRWAIA